MRACTRGPMPGAPRPRDVLERHALDLGGQSPAEAGAPSARTRRAGRQRDREVGVADDREGVPRIAAEVSVASGAADWPSWTRRPGLQPAPSAAIAGWPHSGSNTRSTSPPAASRSAGERSDRRRNAMVVSAPDRRRARRPSSLRAAATTPRPPAAARPGTAIRRPGRCAEDEHGLAGLELAATRAASQAARPATRTRPPARIEVAGNAERLLGTDQRALRERAVGRDRPAEVHARAVRHRPTPSRPTTEGSSGLRSRTAVGDRRRPGSGRREHRDDRLPLPGVGLRELAELGTPLYSRRIVARIARSLQSASHGRARRHRDRLRRARPAPMSSSRTGRAGRSSRSPT